MGQSVRTGQRLGYRGLALGLLSAALLLPPPEAFSQTGKTTVKQSTPATTAVPTPEVKRQLGASLNSFTLDFYSSLKSPGSGNLFVSPYSIATALSMTNAGARGNTQAELARAMHLDRIASSPDSVHASMGALIADYNAKTRNGKARGFQLAVANRLFGAKGATFKPDFLAVNAQLYGAALEPLDFAKATEPSRKAINQWVADKTNNKVLELINPGQLLPDAKLVLVNAIYFRGDWAQPFLKPFTAEAPFTVAPGKKTSVSMMHRSGSFGYFEKPGQLQVLELPYSGGELSMLVMLPAKPEPLAKLESNLSVENLSAWSGGLQPEQVKVSLPKFKITWGTRDVVPELRKLGIKDAFTFPNADFSGIDGGRSLIISLVLHKAFVDVNEEGTEAAAATAVVGAPGGAPPAPSEPKVFTADHPFLFLIRDNQSGTILFIGRVANPAAA